jgi:4'-phosphopantetheinyl transferase
MIRVKFCETEKLKDRDFENRMALLPGFMQDEIITYRFKKDQKSRLIARLMLREQLMAAKQGALLSSWKRLENGKPIISDWNNFSISHSGSLVVYSDSKMDVGIDIEQHDEIDFDALSDFFSSAEKQYILSSTDTKRRFFEIWVKKEAILKALGIGIVNGMKEFNCMEESVTIKNDRWYFHKLEFGDNYTCFLCSKTADPELELEEFVIE